MNYIKTINQISNISLMKLIYNPKCYVLMCLILIIINEPVDLLNNSLFYLELEFTPFIIPFIMISSYFRLIINFGVIALLCDAPFKGNEQIFVMCRTDKTIWVLGQVIYIVKCLFGYYIYIFMISFLGMLPNSSLSKDWGMLINEFNKQHGLANINFDTTIYTSFSPISAVIHTILLNLLLGLFLVMIIFLCNTMCAKFVGITISTTLILSSLNAMQTMFGDWYVNVIPTCIVNLSRLIPNNFINGIPSMIYAYIYLVIINVILIILSVKATKTNMLGGMF